MTLDLKNSLESAWRQESKQAFRRSAGQPRKGPLAALFLALLALSPATALGESDWSARKVERYSIDPYRSYVTFLIGFMKFKTADGTFHDYSGTIMYDTDDVTRSSVTSAIKVESIFTGVRPRDRHLRSPDFFDVEKYPMILFRSVRLRRTSSGLELTGDLTMHGSTKRLSIPLTLFEQIEGADGERRLHCQGSVTLRRRDFGIIGNFWGDKVLSDEVQIDLNIEAEPLTIPDSEMTRMKGLLPIQDVLLKAVEERGVAEATRLYHSIRLRDAARYDLSETELLNLSESLRERGKLNEALAMTRLNLEMHPKHELSWDQLGKLLAEKGDQDGALAAYDELLRINPYNTVALEMLRWLKQPPRT